MRYSSLSVPKNIDHYISYSPVIFAINIYPFPIIYCMLTSRLSSGAESETFIESLSTSTVALFYLAVALYAILLVPNTLAVINQYWLFKYVRKTARKISSVSHNNDFFLFIFVVKRN